jgi:heme-degrading monooxygenase HmoA
MYARTTYACGDPAKIEASLEGLRTEAPKLLADSPGYRSFGLFADREQGKIMMSSWWETERDRAGSDAHLGQRRTELLTPFADTITIDNHEVAVFAPTPQISTAEALRMGRFEVDPTRIDDVVNLFKEVGLPRIERLPGFAAAAMFVDRARGFGRLGTLFTDRATLAASRAPQSAARKEAAERTGMRLICLEEFDVVLVEINPNATQEG